ncbi:hypothetical protein H0G86_008536 [Trichoderma simmonsii]|uniref:Uncharacterized protein n=1 Tax=Trichoderma simmonsii TaxID=1491479 RepID=A0A8G0LFP8_9HYPO|nr:hypothetical protein H0G86_008536 [Trichoderma simmonsii]
MPTHTIRKLYHQFHLDESFRRVDTLKNSEFIINVLMPGGNIPSLAARISCFQAREKGGWDAQVCEPQFPLKGLVSELLVPQNHHLDPISMFVVMIAYLVRRTLQNSASPTCEAYKTCYTTGCTRAMACKNTCILGYPQAEIRCNSVSLSGIPGISCGSGLSQSGSIFHPHFSVWSKRRSWAAKRAHRLVRSPNSVTDGCRRDQDGAQLL